jgi:hypothetical protein
VGRPVTARTAALYRRDPLKVIACAMLGQIAEARDWLERLLELQLGLTDRQVQGICSVFLRRNCWRFIYRSAGDRLAGQ